MQDEYKRNLPSTAGITKRNIPEKRKPVKRAKSRSRSPRRRDSSRDRKQNDKDRKRDPSRERRSHSRDRRRDEPLDRKKESFEVKILVLGQVAQSFINQVQDFMFAKHISHDTMFMSPQYDLKTIVSSIKSQGI